MSVGGGDIKKKVSVNLIEAIKYAKTKKCEIFGIIGRKNNYTVKSRVLQSHEENVREINKGDRAAINLQNISLNEINRGAILAECGCYGLVSDIGVILDVLDTSQFDIS